MSFKKGVNALVWDMTNLFSNQVLKFVLSVYLARLLEPKDFGVVGMAMVFINFANLLAGFGLGASIINKKEPTLKELSSIFYLNLFIGIIFSVAGILGSPYIGTFYNNKLIGEVFQVLSIVILLKSLVIVQNALLYKDINFKTISIIQIVVNVLTAILGVTLAYLGYGVWSLVIMNVSREVLYAITIWLYSKWRPLLFFKLGLIKSYILYGKDIFLSGLITNFSSKLDTLLIGKYTNATQLGYYTRSRSFQVMINNFTGRSLGKVLFPIISKEKDPDRINTIYWSVFIKTIMIVFLLIGILYSIGDELFILLFTRKWENSIPIFKILILASFYMPLEAIFKSYIKGIGKSMILLKTDTIKAVLLLLTFIPIFWGNINLFLWLFLLHHIVAVGFNFMIINRISKNKDNYIILLNTIKIFFIFIISIFLTKEINQFYNFDLILNLIIQALNFLAIYIVLLLVFNKNDISELVILVKSFNKNI